MSLQDARTFNAKRGTKPLHPLLLQVDPRLGEPSGSVAFADAVLDFQRADLHGNLTDDGKLGQLTEAAFEECALWLTPPTNLFEVLHERVRSLMLLLDFRLPKPQGLVWHAAQMRALGLTHVAVGVNSLHAIKDTPGYANDPFKPIYSPERMALASKAYAKHGIKLGAMPWMSASKHLIDGMIDWVEETVAACKDAGAPLWATIPDAEEDWNGAKIEHQALVGYLESRIQGIDVEWICTFVYHMHRAVRPLIKALPDGAMSQLYSHKNAKRPGTLTEGFGPGLLQVRGEDLMDLAGGGVPDPHWHLAPLYGQTYSATRPDQSIRAQLATSIGLGIQDFGFWSEANLRRSRHWPALRRLIASFSPYRRFWGGV